MSNNHNVLLAKLDNNIQGRREFQKAFSPALEQIGRHINDGHVVVNMDLVRILLDYIDGSNRHDEELLNVIKKAKTAHLPALEKSH